MGAARISRLPGMSSPEQQLVRRPSGLPKAGPGGDAPADQRPRWPRGPQRSTARSTSAATVLPMRGPRCAAGQLRHRRHPGRLSRGDLSRHRRAIRLAAALEPATRSPPSPSTTTPPPAGHPRPRRLRDPGAGHLRVLAGPQRGAPEDRAGDHAGERLDHPTRPSPACTPTGSTPAEGTCAGCSGPTDAVIDASPACARAVRPRRGTNYVGSFRAEASPSRWDLPGLVPRRQAGRAFHPLRGARLTEPLTALERRARGGIVARQVTLR